MGHGFHSYVKLPDGLLLGLPQIRWKTRGTSFQIFDHPSLGSSTEGSSMAFFGDADWCMNQTGDVANKRCDMMWLYHHLITMGLDGFDLVMNRRSPIVSGKRTDMGFHTRKWHKLGLSLSLYDVTCIQPTFVNDMTSWSLRARGNGGSISWSRRRNRRRRENSLRRWDPGQIRRPTIGGISHLAMELIPRVPDFVGKWLDLY